MQKVYINSDIDDLTDCNFYLSSNNNQYDNTDDINNFFAQNFLPNEYKKRLFDLNDKLNSAIEQLKECSELNLFEKSDVIYTTQRLINTYYHSIEQSKRYLDFLNNCEPILKEYYKNILLLTTLNQ